MYSVSYGWWLELTVNNNILLLFFFYQNVIPKRTLPLSNTPNYKSTPMANAYIVRNVIFNSVLRIIVSIKPILLRHTHNTALNTITSYTNVKRQSIYGYR